MTPGPAVEEPPAPWHSEESIWQLVECCGYTVDLPFWSGIAAGSRTEVLDLGCGIGRVAHHLGRSGFRVIGVDSHPGVVADFNRESPDREVVAVEGDAAGPGPRSGGFDRIFAPQQLIQIVGDRASRRELLSSIAKRLSPRGVTALALTSTLPDRTVELDLLPDVREIAGWAYMSRPVRIDAEFDSVVITRVRHRISPAGELTETTDRIRFHRLTAATLADELEAVGLVPGETIEVPPTEAHVGSSIVTARSGRSPL